MRTLSVCQFPVLDLSRGAENYIYNCITKMDITHQVTLLCPRCSRHWKNGEFAGQITVIDEMTKSKFKYFSPFMFLRLLKLHLSHDETEINYPWFGIYMVPIQCITRRSFSVRTVDIQFNRYRSFSNILWPLMYLFEYIVYHRAKKVSFISDHDRRIAIKYFNLPKEKCFVEPYIPDETRFFPTDEHQQRIRQLLGMAKDEFFILFNGVLDYRPNFQAIHLIEKELIPRLNKVSDFRYKIIICGYNPPKTACKELLFTGFVRKVEHYVQSCDVFINPIVSGGGVRTKVLEALQCRKRVISTATGAIGIENVDNLMEIVNDSDWDRFAELVVQVRQK